MRGILTALSLLLSCGVIFSAHNLERGDILESVERYIKGSPTSLDLFLLKSLSEEIKEEAPSYMRLFTRGLLEEKRGNKEKALNYYLLSIEENPDYNPSYFRFNALIRKVKNPETYRERIEEIMRKRFAEAPPIIIRNPEDKFLFVVEKMSQYMMIFKGKKLIELHPVTTGIDWEDKWREGDKRTPEGIYYFTEFIPPRKLPKMYGGIAVVLNYPNPVDRAMRKGGYGIWLHGSDSEDRNQIPFSTRGCVVANNDSLRDIVKKIKTHNTLIAIYKTVPDKAEGNEVIEFLKGWERDWESKNFESFIDRYSKKFRWKRGGFKNWERYKRRVILSKDFIEVEIKDLTVVAFLKDDDGKKREYYVAEFRQSYRSNSYSDKGLKRLYIIREGDKLRIISEEFFREGK